MPLITLLGNKYVLYAIIAAVALIAIGTYIWSWEESIKREALLQFNNQQLEQTIQEQTKVMSDLRAINANQKKIIDDMNARNDELETQLKALEEYLASDEGKKDDRPSSNTLKRTVKELSGQK